MNGEQIRFLQAIHEGWKQAIVDAAETDTVFIKNAHGPALRALRTETTEKLERGEGNPMAVLGGGVEKVYFGGDLEAGVALTGEVAGRIESVEPVAQIIEEMTRGYFETVERLAKEAGD